MFYNIYNLELGTAIAQVLPPDALKKGPIVFKLLKTQKQASCVCGYFALAFATALCFGLDPETLFFDQEQLIQHYILLLFFLGRAFSPRAPKIT
jgi:hypothetical protein